MTKDKHDALIGLFVLFSKPGDEPGESNYQGRILERLNDGRYLVQMYSWLDGSPHCEQAHTVTGDWKLYGSHEAWIDEADREAQHAADEARRTA